MNELIFKAWENPNTTYWFISPTFEQAKIQYRRLYGMLSTCWDILIKKNQTELRLKFINQSQIRFVSGEVLENLRGETLHGVVIDEVRDQPDTLWSMVISPMLRTTKGWACFVSTPNGYDQFYDLFQKGGVEKDWESFMAPSTCNPLFTQEEFELARSEMSEDVFNQEILAQFTEIGVGKAYKNHGLHNQRMDNPFSVRGHDWSPYLPIIVGVDFNVGLMVWELAQRKGNHIHFVDEIAVQNTDTEECALVLAKKIMDVHSMKEGPKPPVIIIGDASGNARKTSAVGQTDYIIIKRVLKDHGIIYEDLTPKENPGVKDRINCINSQLKAADGTISLTYNPVRCKYLKRDFERVKWKQGTDGAILDKSDPLATHASDAAGYPICHYNNTFRERPGKMRVLLR